MTKSYSRFLYYFYKKEQTQRPCRLIKRRSYFGLSLLFVVLNLVFKCLLNLRFMYLFLLGNKRLLPLLTSTTRKPATEDRDLAYLSFKLRVSAYPHPSVPGCSSEHFPHLFADRHTVTYNEFVTYTNQNCAIYWLGDKHTRIILNIIIKSWPSLLYAVLTILSKKNLSRQKCYFVSIHDK